MHAERDREADVHLPADRDDIVGIEATVGAHGELPCGPGSTDAPDRLAQEVGGAADGVRPALTKPRHEHVTRAGGDGEQRVVAAHSCVPVMDAALLREAVRLADGGVEIDRERSGAGSRTRGPGPGEEMAGHGVELADMAPAEAAQEGAQGGRRLDDEPEDIRRVARLERGCIVDAVAASERGEDQGQELVTDVRPAGGPTEIQEPLDQSLQTQVGGEGGGQQQARVGHELRPVERHIDPVEVVGRSHPAGVLVGGSVLPEQLHRPRSEGHLFACPGW